MKPLLAALIALLLVAVPARAADGPLDGVRQAVKPVTDAVATPVQALTDGVLTAPPAATAAPAPTAAPAAPAATTAPEPQPTAAARRTSAPRARAAASAPTAAPRRRVASPVAPAARRRVRRRPVTTAPARAATPAARARRAATTPPAAPPPVRVVTRPVTLRTVVDVVPPWGKALVGGLAVALLLALLALLRSRRRLAAALARAHHDALTGLPNRAAADEALARHAAQASRAGTPLSVVMIDIDRFKAINDDHGHATGDRVLQDVAAVLRDGVRGGDVLARWGGEELLLVLPATATDGAEAVAEKLRRTLRDTPVGGLDRPVSASFGVATGHGGDRTVADLLADADDALYRAKAAGRDRVEAAPARRLELAFG